MSNAVPIVQKFKDIVKGKAPGLVRLIKPRRHSPQAPSESIFTPFYLLTAHPGTYSHYHFGWHRDASGQTPHNLLADSPVEFFTQSIYPNITKITLSFGTHQRINTCTIRIECLDATTKESLGSSELNASACIDNQHLHIPLSTQTAAGQWLLIRISSPDATSTNCVAIWGSHSHTGQFRKNQNALPLQLNFCERLVLSHEAVPAPLKEEFYPRYTASCFPNETTEHILGWDGACFANSYLKITKDQSATISFLCDEDNLSKVVLRYALPSKLASCSLILTLSKWDGCWGELFSCELSANSIPDRFYEWKFPPISGSKNSWFKITVSSHDATPESAIAIEGTIVARDTHASQILTRNSDNSASMIDVRKSAINTLTLLARPIPFFQNLLRSIDNSHFNAAIIEEPSDLNSEELTGSDEAIEAVLKNLNSYSAVFIDTCIPVAKSEVLLSAAKKLCIPVIGYGQGSQLRSHVDFLIDSKPTDPFNIYLKFFPEYRSKRLPSFTIISILYNKSAEISHFLDCISAQTYPGQIEVILVDDVSPDDSATKVKERIAREPLLFGPSGKIPITILENAENLGNCGSRNKALRMANNDISVIVDADCLLNRNFIAAHAALHGIGDTDVVIGPHNLETNGDDPQTVLTRFEQDSGKALRDADLQDKIVTQSFLNCITRNFSIRRSFIQGELFDERFSYSKSPKSGFGWEDVEMGCRIYKQGARIAFTEQAFSIHISHPSSCEEGTKPLRSLKNFKRLLETHPDLKYVAGRWVHETYSKICDWIDSYKLPRNEDRDWIDHHLQEQPAKTRTFSRKLRILSYRWHCPHQYEIYKLPHEFTLLQFTASPYTCSWEYDQRPLRPNIDFSFPDKVRFGDYDLAILHFDENVLRPENSNNILGADWGHAFKWFRENVHVPMVAICHGTPQFRGQYNFNYRREDLGTVLDFERNELVSYLADIPVICNSYQAQEEWGFNNSRVIWHGFDPLEFGPMTKGHGILTLGKSMAERPVYRGYFFYEDVISHMPDDIPFQALKVPRPAFDYQTSTNDYARAKFKLYVQAIRNHSVYFNPTQRSPMPRSRGEAMMCGLVPVCANNHDVSKFITQEHDGFYSNNPKEIADYLTFLYRNPAICSKIGAQSRETAMKVFNIQRFHADWNRLVSDILGTTAF